MRVVLFIFSVGLMILSLSCARTSIKSVQDSSLRSTPYKKIGVQVDGDLGFRTKAEDALINKFNYFSSTEVVSTIAMFPPLREYSQQERVTKLKAEGVEAVLMIRLAGAQNIQSVGYTPVYANTFGYVGQTPVNLGTSALQPVARNYLSYSYQSGLLDLNLMQPVWVANSNTVAKNEFLMRSSLIPNTVREVMKSGFMLPRVVKAP